MTPKALALFLACLSLSAANAGEGLHPYTNKVLRAMVEEKYCKEIKEYSLKDFSELQPVIPGVDLVFLIVKTNEGRYAAILAQFAKQKTGKDSSIPMLLIDQFITYREGEEQTRVASGKNLALFKNFQLNLDIGQIVPGDIAADLKYEFNQAGPRVAPAGKASLFLVTRPYPLPKENTPKVVANASAPFDIKIFNGKYKLFDDGRRSGVLTLEVEKGGDVQGSFVSDKEGRKYEVGGKIGVPNHSIQFVIKYPQTEQLFSGFLFTGDGQVLSGSSKMESREAGFYALRIEK
ncbi:MAG: hypothetical protein EXR99_05425 [Gemmataceae bacterium]|nr:hypothetical protein [Gemmataceae bacterium]